MLAVLFCFLVLCWFVTLGDWDFFPPAGMLEEFYDAQAQSLLEGRIDVPADAIGPEAFVHGGKSYGYFGPTPALLRLPLEMLMPAMHGHWSRASMLAASLLAMLSVLLFFRRLERHLALEGHQKLRGLLRATAIVSVALGSSNLFLCAESKVYQEAIIWGAALTLAQAVFLFCYLTEPRTRWLALACAAAFLAFFARVSSGAGALLSLAIVDLAILLPFVRLREYWGVAKASGRPAAIAMSATLLASAACWMGLNYAKFGVLFVSQPMQMNVQYGRERLARIKGDLASLDNLPLTAACYLWPGNIRFGARFPWVYLTGGEQGLGEAFSEGALRPRRGLRQPAAQRSRTTARRHLRDAALLRAAAPGTPRLPRSAGGRLRRRPADVHLGLHQLSLPGRHAALARRGLGDRAHADSSSEIGAPAPCDRRAWCCCSRLTACGPTSPSPSCSSASTPTRFRRRSGSCSEILPTPSAREAWARYRRSRMQWRKYVEAAAFVGGNVGVNRSTGRDDEPVIASQAVPARADYTVALPAAGRYAVDVRCASVEPRPLQLLLNGRVAAVVCGLATGGFMQQQQRWFAGGVFPLPGGLNQLSLASDGPFPAVSMIRLTRVD